MKHNDITFTVKSKEYCITEIYSHYESYYAGYITAELITVNGVAFGFIDRAKNSPNDLDDEHKLSIQFDDWIFPEDGVVIIISKK